MTLKTISDNQEDVKRYQKEAYFIFQDAVRNEDILALLKDALLKVLMEKPSNPLSYLQRHFKELQECLQKQQWRNEMKKVEK